MIEDKRIFKMVECKSGRDCSGADEVDDVSKTRPFTLNQQEWDTDDSAEHDVPGDVSPGRVKKPFEEVM